MPTLPPQFVENMKKQLPEKEWQAFFDCYNAPPVKGVRLNELKGGRYALKQFLPFLGDPIPWEKNGFYVERERLGANPFHFAGAFYSQEPSAMSAAPLLEVKPYEKVLDLCSAPGGKGTQLACEMAGKGIIVLNEPISSRAKILSQNVERMGIKNAVVLNEYPDALATKFQGYFDKILVDAPCSGEGMFRKNAEEALGKWSEENVRLCAERQKGILSAATKMLKVGGRLVYSTCTFAEEEDGGQVRDYLHTHPEMSLLKEEKLYPHRVRGEGHFVALFEKTARAEEWESRLKPCKRSVTSLGERAYREFEKDFFKEKFAHNVHEVNGTLYELPQEVFEWKGLQVLRVGVRLGEVKNGRFEPSHSLAMCLTASECKRKVDFTIDDPRVQRYLHGETVECDEKNGWCLVCICGLPLGFGKIVNGTVKNHLPKALRAVK